MTRRFFAIAALCGLFAACQKTPEKLAYQIVATLPHDPEAFTQGLQWSDGRLFESTGLYGKSTVREIDPKDGKVLRKRPLAPQVFGEGLTLHANELWVLTWKENTVYVLNPENFAFIRSHPYPGEGWGITGDGKQLIMSDGTSTLKFIDPNGFKVVRSLEVMDGKSPVDRLNELEWIDGEIFANVYTTHKIARISPDSGKVTGWLDLAALRNLLPSPNQAAELNGIALDKSSGQLLVTGKNWPRMFGIKLGAK